MVMEFVATVVSAIGGLVGWLLAGRNRDHDGRLVQRALKLSNPQTFDWRSYIVPYALVDLLARYARSNPIRFERRLIGLRNTDNKSPAVRVRECCHILGNVRLKLILISRVTRLIVEM